jgi:hypothetical protein
MPSAYGCVERFSGVYRIRNLYTMNYNTGIKRLSTTSGKLLTFVFIFVPVPNTLASLHFLFRTLWNQKWS